MVLIVVPALWAAGGALFALPWHTFLASVAALVAVVVHPSFRAPGVSGRIRVLLGVALLFVAVAVAAYVHSWERLPEAGLPGFDRAVLESVTDPGRQRARLVHDVVMAGALVLCCLFAGAALAHLPRGRIRYVPGAPTNHLLVAIGVAAFILIASAGAAWSTASGEIRAADRLSSADEVSAVSISVSAGPDVFTAFTVAGLLGAAALVALACARLAVAGESGS